MSNVVRQRVGVFDPMHEAGFTTLEPHCDVVRLWEVPDAERVAVAGTCAGWIVRTYPITADLIRSGPNLAIIAKHGVGVDNIDVAAATAAGVPVTVTIGANSLAVAEHAVAMLLLLAKRLPEGDRAVREGDFGFRYRYSTVELAGKTLGLIGSGRIGSIVARICRDGFGMRVLVYDPYLTDESLAALGAERAASVQELATAADAVSLHAPLTSATRHLIDAEVLRQMKPSALLINCARGELVDQRALAEALTTGVIAGAGLDVFEPEPPEPGDPLLTLPNVVLSPHSANASTESLVRMSTATADEVLRVLNGEPPRYAVNSSL